MVSLGKFGFLAFISDQIETRIYVSKNQFETTQKKSIGINNLKETKLKQETSKRNEKYQILSNIFDLLFSLDHKIHIKMIIIQIFIC